MNTSENKISVNRLIEIKPYQDIYRPQILSIWERSVLATHHFLSQTDFEEIKILVNSIDFNQFEVFCLTDEDIVIGFVGVHSNKIEMLFLEPQYFGQGLGKSLLEFAVNKLEANQLDVNEQNENALKFYRKSGFEILERTEKDEQGRAYPLLRMKLK
ncbi:GNAT family N-acetyltransferase [Chryseobacterium foetidum]|uniref:GNAT family N-acetyltransferase n=1 Tax=Chryseobacterium foetidum TaxID=2951057 RepID=UPI0021C982E0|nr:GNAT family N-acetyltransferase [Chryseobacterium foetidum]